MKPKHPMQPIVLDEHRVARFQANAIIRYLIDHGSIDLNMIAAMQQFSDDDRSQLAQLIGYSVSGFGDLSYANKYDVIKADEAVISLLQLRKPKK
jgi:hypothetical protein